MRVLTDPAETGAVTLALPEDVQTEAFDVPDDLLVERIWQIRRPPPESRLIDDLARRLRRSKRPLIVAGGGVLYSGATDALRELATTTGIPVVETQAGKGSLRYDHAANVGALGATGTPAANELARGADVVIGIGTRWSDFTTASHSAFQHPDVDIVSINVTPFDATKLAGTAIVADARAALDALRERLADWHVDDAYRSEYRSDAERWNDTVEEAYALGHQPLPSQTEVIGAVEASVTDRDVVVAAAGSLPGDLHKLWRVRDPKSYHVEYAFSCMGYEIAAGLGVKMAAPDREVYILVGDGSYLMMNGELVTALSEGIKLIVVLIVNDGFQSIGALSESVGVERFGTQYRFRGSSGQLDGATLPVDLALNAESLGARVSRVDSIAQLRDALREARSNTITTVIRVHTDPLVAAPDSQSWWDVPVAEVSARSSTRAALATYQANQHQQRSYLRPTNLAEHKPDSPS